MSNFICKYCSKEFKTLSGKNGHEPYCKNNSNRRFAWNKGLTKNTDPRVLKYSISMKATKNSSEWIAPIAWNKGLTAETDVRVLKNTLAMLTTKNTIEWKSAHFARVRLNYGGLHYTQTPEYKLNMKASLFKKYGVDSLMKVPEFVDKILKSRYQFKDYYLPSGNIISVQGYEPFALDFIFKILKICENDIVTGTRNVPEIYYQMDGLIKRYYSDIYIKSLNLIVEVKSEFTILCDKNMNILKQLACKYSNYNHEVWLFHENGNLIERIGDLNEYYK